MPKWGDDDFLVDCYCRAMLFFNELMIHSLILKTMKSSFWQKAGAELAYD